MEPLHPKVLDEKEAGHESRHDGDDPDPEESQEDVNEHPVVDRDGLVVLHGYANLVVHQRHREVDHRAAVKGDAQASRAQVVLLSGKIRSIFFKRFYANN